MPSESQDDYLKRREEEELVLALAATSTAARKIHYALALEYRAIIEAKKNSDGRQPRATEPEADSRSPLGTDGSASMLGVVEYDPHAKRLRKAAND